MVSNRPINFARTTILTWSLNRWDYLYLNEGKTDCLTIWNLSEAFSLDRVCYSGKPQLLSIRERLRRSTDKRR